MWTFTFTSLGYLPQSGMARLFGLTLWLSGKEPTCRAGAAGDVGLISGSG